MSNYLNRPNILKGAFIEHGFSIPPMLVVFQFNPDSISRSRQNSFSVPGATGKKESLRDYHQKTEFSDLTELQTKQDVNIGPESISFDIRLDATDKLDEGDTITEQFGISPQLSTLEQMMYPKDEGIIGALLSAGTGYSFTGVSKPPIILFIWGRKKVLPVNITSMNIKEEEFSPELNPIRALVSVNLTVIEGPNLPYQYSKTMQESMSMINITNVKQFANTIIPG